MAADAHTNQQRRLRSNRLLMVAPIVCSLIALAIVVGNVAAGVRPQADEGIAAHLFQLMIAAQVPLVISFIVTADWKQSGRAILALAVQVLAVAAALGSLAWSGY